MVIGIVENVIELRKESSIITHMIIKRITLLASVLTIGLVTSCASDYSNGEAYLKQGDYDQAVLCLLKVEVDDENYLNAQELLKEAEGKIMERDRQKAIEDSTNKYTEELKTAGQTITQLESELNSIKSFDGSKYQDIDGIKMELALLQAWIILVNDSEVHASGEVQKLSSSLKSELIKTQKKEYPLMRSRFSTYLDKTLWEDDIDVAASGSNKTTLTLTGGTFASNANIKEYQTTLYEILTLLRFKRIQYKWYEYDDTYTYYTLEVPTDAELIKL